MKRRGAKPVICMETDIIGAEYISSIAIAGKNKKYLPYVKRFGKLYRKASMFGEFQISNIQTELFNTDAEFSKKLFFYPTYIGKEVRYKAGFADTSPEEFITFFTGIVTSYSFEGSIFYLIVSDKTMQYLKNFHIPVITNEFFENAPSDVLGKRIPILYGNLVSDRENGVCRTYLVDRTNNRYLVAGHHIDDVTSVYALKNGTLYEKITDYQVLNTRVIGKERVIDSGLELWKNEHDLVYWQCLGGVVKDTGFDGLYSAKLYSPDGSNSEDGIIMQYVNLEKGKYLISFTYKAQRRLYIEIYSSRVGTVFSQIFPASDTWKTVEAEVSIPANGSPYRISINGWWEDGYSLPVWVDKISLKPKQDVCMIQLNADYLDYTIACDARGVVNEGKLIENPSDVILHFLTTFCEVPLTSIDTDAFAKVRDNLEELGIKFAGAIYDESSATSILKQMLLCCAGMLFFNKEGKLSLSVFKPEVDPVLSQSFTDVEDILEGSFRAYADITFVRNSITVKSRYNYVENVFKSIEKIQDDEAIDELKREYGFVLELKWIRDEIQAKDIAYKYLLKYRYPVNKISFSTKLHALESDLGNLIEVKHTYMPAKQFELIDKRICQITGLDFDSDRMVVIVEAEDIESFNFDVIFLADESKVANNWDDATEEERKKWCYLVDEMEGKFPDGSPGKRLW